MLSGPVLAADYQLADFNVEIKKTGEALPVITIRSLQNPSRIVWRTRVGEAFLKVLAAKGRASNQRASFTFKDRLSKSCSGQTLERVHQKGETLTLQGSYKDCQDVQYKFSLSAPATDQLGFAASIETAQSQDDYNRLILTYASRVEELFYGFGEQYFADNAKGKTVPIWAQEQGHGRGLQPLSGAMSLVGAKASVGNELTSYSAVASYITNFGRGLCLDNTEYLEFDLETNDEVAVKVWANKLSGRIMTGPTPLAALRQLTDYAGRMLPLPEWTQDGVILRAGGGPEKVWEQVAQAEKAGVALAGLWIEDWVGHRSTLLGERLWWNWEANSHLYPDWPQLIRQLNEWGIKVLTYFNPYLSDVSGADFGAQRNLYHEARNRDFFVRDSRGDVFEVKAGLFGGGMLDLSNPEARNFLKQIMIKQLELGVSGWMADFGEALPFDAQMSSGAKGSAYHNQYTLEWSRLTAEAIREAGKEGEAFSFHRSATLKSPSHNTMFWTGDQLANWDAHDGLGTIIPALTSSGMSGWALSHSDIGGFLGIDILFLKYRRTAELFQRWLELNTFTSLLRTHASNRPKLNHQWNTDANTLQQFSRMTRVFRAMKEYRLQLFAEAYEYGYPVVRHPILHYPDDRRTYELSQQFMLGSEFWIAPVVEQGARQREVYLPAGGWVHLWSGKHYDSRGQEYTVAAPLGQPPVFFKQDSAFGHKLRERLMNEGVIQAASGS
jgi:alpha-glucosidase